MVKYDRKQHLERLHAERKANTHKKFDEAIQKLIKINKTINFNSVSLEAGLTKATLYNNADIRERVETLRHQQAQVQVHTPAQIKRAMDENNKDAIIASLKRKMKKMEEENKQLKKQVKISYGDIYKSIGYV
ncbi:DUF6262 family protein [Clostridium estertheticum]|uniref:DUF6262 family protein n=1 Tax=Clostridium estertheticum TaxID=238834 RepID=UPI0013E9876C|nr:DUF6262 family protein [Clostridium estertheticum]MBZ9686783.1 DUF6262 family protein [Clostridium estertheticum]